MGLMEEIQSIDSRLSDLVAHRVRIIRQAQANCPHPISNVLSVQGYSYTDSWVTTVFCKDCGLGIAANSLSNRLIPGNEEIPSVSCSKAQKIILTLITDRDWDKLMYPMRFRPDQLNRLISGIGKEVFLRYVNKKNHVVHWVATLGRTEADTEFTNDQFNELIKKEFMTFDGKCVEGVFTPEYLKYKLEK